MSAFLTDYFVITERCVDIKDGACVDVCPVDCIHGEEDDRIKYINPDECINCQLCATVCPVEAIKMRTELPGNSLWADVNRIWFFDKELARDIINNAVE